MKSFIIILFILLISAGCSKEWLEKKQDIKLLVPTELNDLDMLLNNQSLTYDGRGASEMSSDEAVYTPEQFNALQRDFLRDLATWNVSEFIQFGGANQDEWDISYSQIHICNVVLAALEKINRTSLNYIFYDRIKGTALYHRSRQFLNLAMTFCKYYDPASAQSDLGIPLKLSDDIAEPIFRASLEDTYQKIVDDLKLSCKLLPVDKISYTHIAKGGAYALLARCLLFMDKYEEAGLMADSSFYYHNFLEDYNAINPTPSRPLNIQSKEIHVPLDPRMAVSYATVGRINPDLYNSYIEQDLRKVLFFKKENDGMYSFRGHYRAALFSGTSTPEVLLISAECQARLGKINIAMQKLNLLLEKRIKTGEFLPVQASSRGEAISIILSERRKELLTRCLRWQDLKRLNRDPQFARTIERRIGTQVFTLQPNDPKYVLPIPQYIINFNGIEQNVY